MAARKDQFLELDRLILAHAAGLGHTLDEGEEMPLMTDVIAEIRDEFVAATGAVLLRPVEIEALIFRRLLVSPLAGFDRVRRYYLA